MTGPAMEAFRDFVKGLATEEEERPVPKPQRPTSSKVTLHVYDFLEQGLNGMLRQVGTGGFHCGVEVYGKEWSFRRTLLGTGIYWIPPKSCTAHKYRESVSMGKVNMSEDKFLQLVHRLKKEWPGSGYDILRRNCCVFSNELCQKLGVGPVPDWITNLAGVGADLRSVVRRPLRQMEEVVFGEESEQRQSSRPTLSQQGRQSPPIHAPPPRPVSHRDGYEKLEHHTTRLGKEGLRHQIRTYGPGAVWVTMFLGLCALAGAAGAGRLPRPAWPWRSTHRPQGTVKWSRPSILPAVPVASGSLLSFDCNTGFDTWVVSWSLKQSEWCCKHAGRGCPGANSSAFSCQVRGLGGFEDWSPYELDWCCLHRRIGCHRLVRFASSGRSFRGSRGSGSGAGSSGRSHIAGNDSQVEARPTGSPNIGIGVGVATAAGSGPRGNTSADDAEPARNYSGGTSGHGHAQLPGLEAEVLPAVARKKPADADDADLATVMDLRPQVDRDSQPSRSPKDGASDDDEDSHRFSGSKHTGRPSLKVKDGQTAAAEEGHRKRRRHAKRDQHAAGDNHTGSGDHHDRADNSSVGAANGTAIEAATV